MTIRFECEGAVAILTIDRPKVHNALDFETSDALVDAWMRFRDALCEKGFSFEYSATFGQAVKGNAELTSRYARNILFDYSYRYFYGDGFGKDYRQGRGHYHTVTDVTESKRIKTPVMAGTCWTCKSTDVPRVMAKMGDDEQGYYPGKKGTGINLLKPVSPRAAAR